MTKYDILIAGSGFAGSLMALCLNRAGFNVCLIEKDSHPRFAVGESSTPIADMILRDLSHQYHLPWLKNLSRYGSWQKHYPDLTCGIKRGFSYYKHQQGKEFYTDQGHTNELLVAASVDDYNSDTQWLRSEMDHFLVNQLKDYGIDYHDRTEILHLQRKNDDHWIITAEQPDRQLQFKAEFIIDATGSPAFSEKFFKTSSSSNQFKTDTRAVYSHFTNVPRWLEYLEKNRFKTDDYPFNPDHSALHHIVDEGWVWMLRFNDDRLSAGVVVDQNHTSAHGEATPGDEEWNSIIDKYPSLHNLFSVSKLCDEPGKIIRTGRLQRKLDQMFGDGWVALHHTAGFVDPLHSTGIAHSLSGVEKLLNIITSQWNHNTIFIHELNRYQDEFFSELKLIDLLVAGCYKTRHHFDLFTAWAMIYFTCTIQYEQKRMAGSETGLFLRSDHTELRAIADKKYKELQQVIDPDFDNWNRVQFINDIKESIKPYNIAGLMDPEKRNMYRHTAVEF